MKIKKTPFIITLLAILGLVISIVLFFLNQKRKEVHDDHCTAVMEFHDTESGFSAGMNVVLVLNPKEYGYIDMSGHVTYKGNYYTLSREIKFTYENEGNNIYKLSELTQIKQTSDTTPDRLMDSIFFSMSHEKARNMTLKRIRNAYVVGNLHSPVFMCVIK